MDWAKFFNMGGYAFYVWGTYSLAVVMLGLNVWLPIRELRRQQKQRKHDIHNKP